MESFSSEAFFAWDEANRTAGAEDVRGELLQTLTALTMDAGWVRAHLDEGRGLDRKLGEMLELLRGAVVSAGRIAAGLRPLMLEADELLPAIRFLAGEFERHTGATCELQLDERVRAEEPCAMGVYRIAQDWLGCIALEGARRVRIRLAPRLGDVVLQVQDDGAAGQGSGGRRQALSIVRERARLLGGTLGLSGVPGLGAQLEARIPWARRLAS